MFAMMRSTGQVFEIVYKGKVYDMHVITTDKKPMLTRPKRKRNATVQRIDTSACTQCDSILVAGICMNKKCPTNSR
jgi:hypothetical protein